MNLNVLNNRTLLALGKALDGSSQRQKAIAHNIANINTPNYKKINVSFQDQLQAALGNSQKISLSRTNERHIQSKPKLSDVEPIISRDNSTSMRPDKNNVDIDQEMTQLAENTIYYYTLISQLNKRISHLKHIISEGRR